MIPGSISSSGGSTSSSSTTTILEPKSYVAVPLTIDIEGGQKYILKLGKFYSFLIGILNFKFNYGTNIQIN